MAKGKGAIQGWITKNGIHIPIYGTYTVREGHEPTAKGAKFKSGKVTAKTVSKALKKEYDEDSKETWYEGKINGKDVRITQETAGSNKFWNVDIGKPGNRHKLLTDNNEPMSFKSLEDAHDEIAHELNSKSGQDSVASKGKRAVMTKSEFDTMNKEIDARDETEHLKKWEGQYDKTIAGGATVKKGKKYEDRDWNKDVDDAKRYGYSEQSETGKKPITKAEEEKQARQSFRDKKAQEQGFADDASMRSYNEETGVNKETWKATPESYAQSKGKSIRDIAQEVNKNDVARAQANRLMKDGRTYEEAAALAHSDMERGVLKGQESSTPDFSKMSYSEAGKYVSEHKKDFGLKAGDDAYQAAYEMKQGTWKQPQTATKQNKNSVSTTESYPWIKSFGSNEPSASEYGKAMDSINQRYDRETKTVPGREMGKVFEGLKPGDQIKVHNRWSTSPNTYTVNADGTIDYYTPSSSFLGKKGMSLAEAQKHATNDVDNRITVMRKKSEGSSTSTRTEKQDSLSAGMNERSRIRGELHAKDKAMKATIPTTVSGLRSAYADATGSMKSKIAAELRRKGYSLVGGKWVKGRKE